MSKRQTPAPKQTEPEVIPARLQQPALPQTGGCFVRNADGGLERSTIEREEKTDHA